MIHWLRPRSKIGYHTTDANCQHYAEALFNRAGGPNLDQLPNGTLLGIGKAAKQVKDWFMTPQAYHLANQPALFGLKHPMGGKVGLDEVIGKVGEQPTFIPATVRESFATMTPWQMCWGSRKSFVPSAVAATPDTTDSFGLPVIAQEEVEVR